MDNIHEAICVLQNSEIHGNIIFKMNYSTNIMKISLDLKNVLVDITVSIYMNQEIYVKVVNHYVSILILIIKIMGVEHLK